MRENQQNSESDIEALAENKRKMTRTVRPYVEVQFQHRKSRTAVGDGPNPCWNETLELPFEPPGGDFRPESLQVVRDNVYINIFDEFIVDLNTDDRDRRTRIHQRKERNWLGTLVIPFATLYEHVVVSLKINELCRLTIINNWC
jgi:Ca2+-dependent lipid-binding protein